MKKILRLEQWENVIRNLEENDEEVEVLWLDGADEFVLACDVELFEDGFETELEAMDRLEYILEEVKRV